MSASWNCVLPEGRRRLRKRAAAPDSVSHASGCRTCFLRQAFALCIQNCNRTPCNSPRFGLSLHISGPFCTFAVWPVHIGHLRRSVVLQSGCMGSGKGAVLLPVSLGSSRMRDEPGASPYTRQDVQTEGNKKSPLLWQGGGVILIRRRFRRWRPSRPPRHWRRSEGNCLPAVPQLRFPVWECRPGGSSDWPQSVPVRSCPGRT